MTVDPELGGAGLGYLAHTIVMEEISRASAAVGLSYGAHSNLCVNQLALNGSPVQQRRYLPKLISGEHVGALAMSEPSAGSDVVSMQLKAQRRGDCYVLHDGRKIGSPTGRKRTCWWCTPKPNRSSVPAASALLSSRRTSWVSRPRKSSISSVCAAPALSELVFDGCEVPAENLLGQENQGVRVLMRGLDYERVVLSGGPLGIMAAALDVAWCPMCASANSSARPSAHSSSFRARSSPTCMPSLNACRSYVYMVAAACDRNDGTRKDAAACILFCAEAATRAALDAIQLLGGNGYINDYPTGRLLRDAQRYEIGAGTSEIRRMLIGRELFGEGA